MDGQRHPYDNGIAWTRELRRYENPQGRLWIVVTARRRPLAKDLENWLFSNASLVWRKFARRFDYPVEGFQVFLVQGSTRSSEAVETAQP